MPTNVTGILVDSLGQKWANAPVQFIFYPTPSTPGPFTANGADFDKMPPSFLTDANGSFSITLPSNSEIQPALSNWQMIVGPNSTYPATVINFYVTGYVYDISAAFTSSGAVRQVQSLQIPRAYQDSEMLVVPNVGQIYYNVTERVLKYWESGNWVPIGGSSHQMVYPPAGIGVSTGNSWAASIDPARIAYLDTANTFTANQRINGDVSAFTMASGSYNVSNRFYLVDRQTSNVTGPPNINSDGNNLVLNPSASGRVYLNLDQGAGISFGNGSGGTIGYINPDGSLTMSQNGSFGGLLTAFAGQINSNLNVGSFQINGSAPNGYILMGDGTHFVPQALTIPKPSIAASENGYGRQFGVVYQNTSGNPIFLSGTGRTTQGGSVGSTQVLIGLGDPQTEVWGMTGTATIQNGVIGFYAIIPPGFFYKVMANTLSQGPGGGNAVTTIGNWTETQIYNI